mmetsp:Transcript_48788/g.56062  ORF Transcript_48788/g.56062 Transcript_48788/m.56062 type:complete len:224 (+) Transcript_48788:270-941(+)
MGSKSSADLLDPLGVTLGVLFVDSLGGEAIETKAVQDRSIETTHSSKRRVNMQGVGVLAQSVDQSLVNIGLFGIDSVGVFLGNNDSRRQFDNGLTTKSANTSNENIHLDLSEHFFLFVRQMDVDDNQSTLLLVNSIRDAHFATDGSFDGQGFVQFNGFFSMQKHHGVELGHTRTGNKQTEDISLHHDNSGSRESGEIFISLKDESHIIFISLVGLSEVQSNSV